MTGYEKSPDYGGGPATAATWIKVAVFALVLIGLGAVIAFAELGA